VKVCRWFRQGCEAETRPQFFQPSQFLNISIENHLLSHRQHTMFKCHVNSAIGRGRPAANEFSRVADGIAASLRQFSVSLSRSVGGDGTYSLVAPFAELKMHVSFHQRY
jgi:hypothetical protein